MGLQRINEIDGLRAIAMTIVIAQHCGLAPFGWTGVWLFFVISGYVISRNFINEKYIDINSTGRYKNFMIKRIFRIIPVYFLYLIINIIFITKIGDFRYFNDIPFITTFTYNWHMIYNFIPRESSWNSFEHLWTLSVEEQFYIIYPLLFLLLPKNRYLNVIIIFILSGPLIRYAYASALADVSDDSGWIAFAVYAASFTQFDAFLLGALVANYEGEIRKRPWLAHWLAAIAGIAAGTYAITYVAINRSLGATGIDVFRDVFSGTLHGQHRELFVYSVITIASAAALVYAILQKSFMRPLAWPATSLVGRISYGGYLFHALVIWMLGNLILPTAIANQLVLERVIWFVAVWLITVALAYLSFRYFEQPIIRWSRKLTSKSLSPQASNQVGP